MAAGMDYSDYTVLEEYPCDVESIVRYRGGFNFHAKAFTSYANYVFNPGSPMWVNLTTREVYPLILDSWDGPDSTISTETNYIVHAMLYNRVKVEEGATVTLILRANEVSFSALENDVNYIHSNGTVCPFNLYSGATDDELVRTTVKTNLSTCMFVW